MLKLWFKLRDWICTDFFGLIGTCAVVGALLWLGGCSSLGSTQEFSSPYFSARDQVVALVAKNGGNGSGVIIAPNTILTARHVAKEIAEGTPLQAIDRNGKKLGNATVVRVGTKDLDLAILHVDNLPCPVSSITGARECAVIAKDTGKTDEPLVLIGFPLRATVGIQYLTKGQVEGQQVVDKVNYLLMAVHAAGGNSGGGVFVYREHRWEVLGVLVAGLNEPVGLFSVPTNYISAAMPNNELRAFLAGKNSQDGKNWIPDTGTL